MNITSLTILLSSTYIYIYCVVTPISIVLESIRVCWIIGTKIKVFVENEVVRSKQNCIGSSSYNYI